MAVKSKGGSAALKREHTPGAPKTTSIEVKNVFLDHLDSAGDII
jgi:hypothetical protein